MIKEYKNYIFVDGNFGGVLGDCSDGYLKSIDGVTKVKLPHKNYEILGIVDECLTAPYAEEFSKEIVDYSPNGGGYWNYSHEGINGWVYQLKTAVESMKTLIEKLDLKPTDYIYGEEKNEEMYAPDILQSKADFIIGFNAGQPKWISVDKQLPNNDRTVLVWVNNTQNPQWSGYKLGSHINGKWYCKGGRESHEIVTDWCQIPARKW